MYVCMKVSSMLFVDSEQNNTITMIIYIIAFATV